MGNTQPRKGKKQAERLRTRCDHVEQILGSIALVIWAIAQLLEAIH